MTRAFSIAGNNKEKEKYLKLTKKAVEQIADKDDKEYALREIATIN